MPFKNAEERREYYRKKAYHKSASKKEYQKRYYEENKDRQRCKSFQKLYGITLEEYNQMLEEQDNQCGICGVQESEADVKLSVDHCHETGIIRGLLCRACNTGIGNLRDSIELLEKAVDYLNAYSNPK